MSVNNIPDFRVSVDGVDITPRLKGEASGSRRRLVSLSISEKRGGEADQLDLVIDDTDGLAPLPKEGARIHVELGWVQGAEVTPGLVSKGDFIIDEVEHSGPPDTITVRARSADFTSKLKNRREKSWHGTTLGTIVQDVARRHGLKPRCAPSMASIPITAKAQSRESDLAFLKRLGREHDAVATIKRGSLLFSPIGAGTTPTGKPLPTIEISRRDGDRHNFKIAKREEATGVTASWHDRRGAKKQKVTVGTEEGAKHLSRTYASEPEARRAAEAEKNRSARAPLSLNLLLSLGRAAIYPEQRVKVAGFKTEINAVHWLISEVSHRIGNGFTTELSLEAVGA